MYSSDIVIIGPTLPIRFPATNLGYTMPENVMYPSIFLLALNIEQEPYEIK